MSLKCQRGEFIFDVQLTNPLQPIVPKVDLPFRDDKM